MIITSGTVFYCLGAVYCYLWFALSRATKLRGWRSFALFLFLAAMAGLYLFRHYQGDDPFLAFALRLGLVFIPFGLAFAGLLLGATTLRLLGRLLRRPPEGLVMRCLRPARAAAGSCALALIVTLVGLYNAYNVQPVHLTLTTDKLPQDSPPVRLAIVSDVHVGHLVGPGLVGRIADIVNESGADIFLSLGDLVDKNIPENSTEARLLRGIRTRYGSYGVLGNHEFYNDYANALAFHEEAGIRLLRGRGIDVGPVRLLGWDDREGVKRGYVRQSRRLDSLRENADSGRYTIVLHHRPLTPKAAVGLFDVQLSGHLHGGQAWPVSLYIRKTAPYTAWRRATLSRSGRESALFVTHGAGLNGPPFRFLVPAEVVILDIVPAARP